MELNAAPDNLQMAHATLPRPLLQTFKKKSPDLRESCRHIIRKSIQDKCAGKSLIGPISELDIWPVMIRFLLMKDLPRTRKGIEKMERFHPKLKLLCPEEEEDEEDEEEVEANYASEILDELL